MSQDSIVRKYERLVPEVVQDLESRSCWNCGALRLSHCETISGSGQVAFWHKSRRDRSRFFDSLGNLLVPLGSRG